MFNEAINPNVILKEYNVGFCPMRNGTLTLAGLKPSSTYCTCLFCVSYKYTHKISFASSATLVSDCKIQHDNWLATNTWFWTSLITCLRRAYDFLSVNRRFVRVCAVNALSVCLSAQGGSADTLNTPPTLVDSLFSAGCSEDVFQPAHKGSAWCLRYYRGCRSRSSRCYQKSSLARPLSPAQWRKLWTIICPS